MKIISVNNPMYQCNNTSFNALKVSPALEKWPTEILDAINNSKTIKSIIEKDVKNGRDTVMRYVSKYCPYTYCGTSSFKVESATKNINLECLVGTNIEMLDESVNDKLVNKLASKIRNLDDLKKDAIDKLKGFANTAVETIE